MLESHDAGWTCVADAAVSASNQLVAVTFSQQFCGVWAANLSSDKTSTLTQPSHSRGIDLSEGSSLRHHLNPSAASSSASAASVKHATALAAATAKVHVEDRLPGLFQVFCEQKCSSRNRSLIESQALRPALPLLPLQTRGSSTV